MNRNGDTNPSHGWDALAVTNPTGEIKSHAIRPKEFGAQWRYLVRGRTIFREDLEAIAEAWQHVTGCSVVSLGKDPRRPFAMRLELASDQDERSRLGSLLTIVEAAAVERYHERRAAHRLRLRELQGVLERFCEMEKARAVRVVNEVEEETGMIGGAISWTARKEHPSHDTTWFCLSAADTAVWPFAMLLLAIRKEDENEVVTASWNCDSCDLGAYVGLSGPDAEARMEQLVAAAESSAATFIEGVRLAQAAGLIPADITKLLVSFATTPDIPERAKAAT